MIVGDYGVIIVDPPEDVKKGLITLKEFRKFSDKPVKAVIYSHWHIDHYAGVAAFASPEDAASGKVKIIAHKTFLANMIKNSTGGTGPNIQAPDLMRAFPTAEFIRGLRFRLQAENTLDVNMTMGFVVPDINEAYSVEIRRGVAQFYESLPENADVIMEMDRATLDSMLTGDMEALGIDGVQPASPQATLAAIFQSGKARLTRGTAEDFQKFFSYFDPISNAPIPITIQ